MSTQQSSRLPSREPGAHAHTGQQRYSRAVSPMEWAFLGTRPGHSLVQHVVEGEGTLRADQLAAAVAVASEASPGTRLIREGQRWVDSGTAPVLRVLDGGSSYRELLHSPALRTPLGATGATGGTDATCEVLLVPGEPSTVVFRAFHGVTDGRGLLLWALDVFRVLRGEDPLGAASALNHHELVQQLHLPGGLPPTAPAAPLEWPSPLGPRSRASNGLLWRRRSVDGSHAAATAKVAAALAGAYGPGPFFAAVDLRRHDPDLRSTAMLAHGLRLDVRSGDGWQQVHQQMLTALAEHKELAMPVAPWILRTPLPLMRLANAGIERAATRKGRYSSQAYISHLGAIDLADLSTDDFQATTTYALGGTSPGGPPEIDLVESGGRTEITLAWHDGPGTGQRADDLLDVVEEALSPREYRQWAGNRTERPLPSEHSVVRLFREQAERTPHRTALSGPEGDVTYAELSLRADAVAAELRRLGAGPGTVVGLLADRSVAAVAGLWGVLRAGACYLPLDARHPDARIAELLADAGSAFCLVQRPYEQRECVPPGCRSLILDELAASGGSDAESFQDAAVSPGDLAYIIYTSGSTGRPKGVQIEHQSLLNYVHWATRAFDVDAETRLPLLTSPSFDVSGTSVFLPLLVGGEVVLLRDDPNHLSLGRLLEHSGANALNLTPSHLDLIGRLDLAPTGFRTVVVVGEQLRVEVAARAQEMFGPKCRIINLYGPTEATIGCTAHTFDREVDGGSAVVPIGLPADNTTVYLLDGERRFVAPGEVGEMYLGGAQLARGYLGRPDLDRERFPRLADGSRVYRTGDLARTLPSGEIEFVGRIDDQVKVRGHRVEPAEVAQAFEDHPAVDRAVVVARTRAGRSGKALYGYVLANAPVTADELEEYVASRLPAYMVPAATVVVPELPYTVSGKVDVRALPDPFGDEPGTAEDGGADPNAPVDPVEEAVAQIWARTLGVERSRLDGRTDFHRMGGDSVSLLAMLAGVCREVLDPGQEDAFMGDLAGFLGEPTLERVTALIQEALAERPAR
ncbi:amino acid adenylation domain-containing protein [Streptacidiphilus sp. MAP12-16]|uniref:non-ribosomal peptide synthetase n=1 Tax=Streptacidiphilus sp. MAP12-16 TaxID=3156300 RepID=UPI003515FB2C